MKRLFADKPTFNDDISKWNTASASDMTGLFNSATAFNQNLSSWNVLRATNLTSAFESTPALLIVNKRSLYVAWGATLRSEYPLFCLIDANVQGAVTSWVTNSATATTTYGPIADWDVRSVSNMLELFAKKPTFNADISKWNVASVSTMAFMFNAANSFDCNIARWNVANVANLGSIFNDPIALTPCNKAAIYMGWGTTLRLATRASEMPTATLANVSPGPSLRLRTTPPPAWCRASTSRSTLPPCLPARCSASSKRHRAPCSLCRSTQA
jgi:hypothetical protein